MVATGKASEVGVLIKDAVALEKANKIEAIIFDKTGTLTSGKPSIVDFVVMEEKVKTENKDLYINLIYLVESRSKHPISQAVIQYIKETHVAISPVTDFTVKTFESIPGYGIQATINDYNILIGAHRFLEQNNIVISQDILDNISKWQQEGKTITFVAINGKLIVYYSTTDTIRESALPSIKELNSMGITTLLMTGDNPEIAQLVAQKLGITTFFARVLPEEKSKKIETLKETYLVAMVGDRINDAPALAVADVAIAMGEGTDIAFETAHMSLLHNNLALIPFAIRLSQATVRNIRQNLVWAFGYNIVLIPVAMGLLYPFFGITFHPMLISCSKCIAIKMV
jgi:P-type Cu+ transporter